MSIGRRRKTDRVIVRTPKQDLQSEYAWLVAKMINAIGVLEQYNRYVSKHILSGNAPLHIPYIPFVKQSLQLEYLARVEEEKSTNA